MTAKAMGRPKRSRTIHCPACGCPRSQHRERGGEGKGCRLCWCRLGKKAVRQIMSLDGFGGAP